MPPKKKRPDFTKKNLLALLKEAGSPVRAKTIFGHFEADAAQKKIIKATLAHLVTQGELIQAGKSYTIPDALPRLTGTLDIRRNGAGYLILDTPTQRDLYIPPACLNGAWPGDRVEAVVESYRRKDSPEGRVVRILERGITTLMARAIRRVGETTYLCQPTDARLTFTALVDASAIAQPEKGDILHITPVAEQENGLWQCTALRCLGRERELATQELLVKTSHAIAEHFPETVLRQARALPADPEAQDWANRLDLRSLPLVTIDGETAKDFDDAVYVERLERGYRLMVAIADVAHYVHEDSELDKEAQARGNSYYFPLSVEPMLPQALSDGLCSLRPQQPRLAMVVDTTYALDGKPEQSRFHSAVIMSHARLTYTQVQAALDTNPDAQTEPFLPMLETAAELAKIFLRQREARGCLDFDIPEGRILIEAEEITVQAGVRLFAHRLIEEFMIAANERVAEFLGSQERIFPYRVHPQPDESKLEKLLSTLSHTTLVDKLPANADQQGLQQLTRAAKGSDMEFMVNRLILRTMMQAQYAPENGGHYGLASESYCHFTSPIRRYADLMTHRSLKRLLAGAPESMSLEKAQTICSSLNALERKAMEAEREIQKRAAILALENRIGEEMRGVISGVAEFGFWVELVDMPVDGLVRLATLDDFYVYDPKRQDLLGQRTGRTFSIGQALDVILDSASLERVEINFSLPVPQKGGAGGESTVRRRRS